MWVSPPFCFWMHANQTESHLSLLLFSLKESAKRDNGNPPGAVAETSRDRGQQTKARLYDTISKTYIRVSMVNHSWQTCMYLQIGEPRQYESMHKESIFRPEYHPNTLPSFVTHRRLVASSSWSFQEPIQYHHTDPTTKLHHYRHQYGSIGVLDQRPAICSAIKFNPHQMITVLFFPYHQTLGGGKCM